MKSTLSALILVAVGLSNPCYAQNGGPDGIPPAAPDREPADVTPESELEMRRLLQQLESPRFSRRRAASMRLQQMGAAAHGSLEKIATSADAERAVRALDLLKQAARDLDPAIAASAREALERIAASDRPQARGARQALRPREPEMQAPMLPGFPRQLLAPIPAPAFAQKGRTNLRISVKSVNGTREIEVIQNDKRYHFRDVPGGLETERPDGKGGVKKQLFKNAEELKKKAPEAFDAYQKAGGDRAGKKLRGTLQLGTQQLGRGMFGIPGVPNQPAIPKPGGPNPKALPNPRLELLPDVVPPPVPQPKRTVPKGRIEV